MNLHSAPDSERQRSYPGRLAQSRIARREPLDTGPGGQRIVALGGGTGLPTLLRGLKSTLFPAGWAWLPSRDRERITAIVTVADDGGSSGRLRRDYAVPPPGDLRNCLLALAEGDPTMAAIFNYRFPGQGEVAGHNLGNLILTALTHLEEDGLLGALKQGSDILEIRGRVLPTTLDAVSLRAEFADGSVVDGETRIAAARRLIHRLMLQPNGVSALPEALEAIERADLIVIGPGSLYTSLIATLLVKDLSDAIARSTARVVLVMNLMTEPGETDSYTAVDHVLAIRRHAPAMRIDDVLVNTTPIPREPTMAYGAQGAAPVPSDAALLRALGYRLIDSDLLAPGDKIRHDPVKLARALLEPMP